MENKMEKKKKYNRIKSSQWFKCVHYVALCDTTFKSKRPRAQKQDEEEERLFEYFFFFGVMCFVFDVSISTVPRKLVPRTKKKHCCRIHTPTRPTIPTLILLQSNFFLYLKMKHNRTFQ